MTTIEQNGASERLRGAIKNAIFALANNPDKVMELKAALDDFRDCHTEREANEFLMEEVLEGLGRIYPPIAAAIKDTINGFAASK